MTTTIFSNKLDNRFLASFGGFSRSVLRPGCCASSVDRRRRTQAEMAKMVAEGEGQARSEVERARGEATGHIERAKGEAEANRVRQASITPQLLEWKRLENQRALIEKWNGELPRLVVGEKSGLLMPLPTDQR